MKLIQFLVLSMLTMSAFAGELSLRNIENADEYESVEMEYDVTYGPTVILSARRYNGVPRHQETYVDVFMVKKSAISYIRGNLIVIASGKPTICASMKGDILVETGKCSIKTEVVDNMLNVSLVTQD